MASYWRVKSNEVITQVIAEVGCEDDKRLRKAISEAYPFGERKHWPYKVWLDEVKRVLDRRSTYYAKRTVKSLPGQRNFPDGEPERKESR